MEPEAWVHILPLHLQQICSDSRLHCDFMLVVAIAKSTASGGALHTSCMGFLISDCRLQEFVNFQSAENLAAIISHDRIWDDCGIISEIVAVLSLITQVVIASATIRVLAYLESLS